jgi:hypothetical protein
MRVPSDNVTLAIEAFVRGRCAGKSATHPYEWSRVNGLWVMRDAPRRNPRDYRKEEWVAYNVEPAAADAAARRETRGRFFIGAILAGDESDEPLRAEYRRLGYRLLEREGLFWHTLTRIPRASSRLRIVRVRTSALAATFGQATRSRPIPPEHLGTDAPFRQYVAVEGDALVGWVRSVDAGESTWCSNMYVQPSRRRRGIGRALLVKMLRDDRRRGARRSVLLSSKAGTLLYPHVGYKQLGALLIFAPVKR